MPDRNVLNLAGLRSPKPARNGSAAAATLSGCGNWIPTRRQVLHVGAGVAGAAMLAGCRVTSTARPFRTFSTHDSADAMASDDLLAFVNEFNRAGGDVQANVFDGGSGLQLWVKGSTAHRCTFDTRRYDGVRGREPKITWQDQGDGQFDLFLLDAFYCGSTVRADSRMTLEVGADRRTMLTGFELTRFIDGQAVHFIAQKQSLADLLAAAASDDDDAAGAWLTATDVVKIHSSHRVINWPALRRENVGDRRDSQARFIKGRELHLSLRIGLGDGDLPDRSAHQPWGRREWWLKGHSSNPALPIGQINGVGDGSADFDHFECHIPCAAADIEAVLREDDGAGDSNAVDIDGQRLDGLMVRHGRRRAGYVFRSANRWTIGDLLPEAREAGRRPGEEFIGWNFTVDNDAPGGFGARQLLLEATMPPGVPGGAPRLAMMVGGDDSRPMRARYFPGGALGDATGCPFYFPLDHVRVGVAFDPVGDHVAVMAQFAPAIFRMAVQGCIYEFRNPLHCDISDNPLTWTPDGALGETGNVKDERPAPRTPFELALLGRKFSSFHCRPLLWRVNLAMSDMSVVPDDLEFDGSPLDFDYGQADDQGPLRGQVRIYLRQLQRDPDTGDIGPRETTSIVRTTAPQMLVLRPRDLLKLEMRFDNADLVTSSTQPPRLFRHRAGIAALIVAGFPPQHIAEESILLGDLPEPIDAAKNDATKTDENPAVVIDPPFANPGRETEGRAIRSFLSGSSRVVLRMPDQEESIPFSSPYDLLGWKRLETVTQPPQSPGVPAVAPGPTETSIEAPAKLILTPGPAAKWVHASEVRQRVIGQGSGTANIEVAELWHSRLAARDTYGEMRLDLDRPVRAVFNRDREDGGSEAFPGWAREMTLLPEDRDAFVERMRTGERSTTARELMLTSLGATLDLFYSGMPHTQIESWKHRATLGRDHFVEVVRGGELWPFGHRASYIRVCERQFRQTTDGPAIAWLVRREYIQVHEPSRYVPGGGCPLRRVTLVRTVSPNLNTPDDATMFWPTIAGDEAVVFWPIECEDQAGVAHTSEMAFMFVAYDLKTPGALAYRREQINQEYHRAEARLRSCRFNGAKIAYARPTPPAEPDPDADSSTPPAPSANDTAYDTDRMEFGSLVEPEMASGDKILETDITDIVDVVWRLSATGMEEQGANTREIIIDLRSLLPSTLRPEIDRVAAQAGLLEELYKDVRANAAEWNTRATRLAGALDDALPKIPSLGKVRKHLGKIDPVKGGRMVLERICPTGLAKVEETAAIFAQRIDAAEFRDLQQAGRELGIVADRVTAFLLQRLGGTDALKELTNPPGQNGRKLLDALNTSDLEAKVQQILSEAGGALYEALEESGIEIPQALQWLREQAELSKELFVRLNRKLIEIWSGARFVDLAPMVDAMAGRYASLINDLWSDEVQQGLRELRDQWSEALERRVLKEIETPKNGLDLNGLIKKVDPVLRRELAEFLTWRSNELVLRDYRFVIEQEARTILEAHLGDRLSVAVDEVLKRSDLLKKDFADIPQEVKAIVVAAQYFKLRVEPLNQVDWKDVNTVLTATYRKYAGVAERLGALLSTLVTDDPALIAKTVVRTIFGATIEADFRPIVDRLAPLRDPLGQLVNSRISREARELLDKARADVAHAEAAARKLAGDLDRILDDPELIEQFKCYAASFANPDGRIADLLEKAKAGATEQALAQLNRDILATRFPGLLSDARKYLPVLREASVGISSVQAMLGAEARTVVAYADTYIRHGFDAVRNQGEVFLRAKDQAGEAIEHLRTSIEEELRAKGAVAREIEKNVEKAERELRAKFRKVQNEIGDVAASAEKVKEQVGKALAQFQETVGNKIDEFKKDFTQLAKRLENEFGKQSQEVGTVGKRLLGSITGELAAKFPADRFSGMALPDLTVTGLGRKAGVVAGDLAEAALAQLDPRKYFPSAKLFNKLDLAKIVQATFGTDKMPKLKTELDLPRLPDGRPVPLAVPRTITTTFDWNPRVQSLAFFKVRGNPDQTLRVTGRITASPADGKVVHEVTAKLTDFSIDLFSFIDVRFGACTFTNNSSECQRCDPKVREITFGGPLALVQRLRERLGSLFGDGFGVDVMPAAVAISANFDAPDISMGVFTMRGLKISSNLELPLVGDEPMKLGFALAQRDAPFQLAVSTFGGGGYFLIKLRTGEATDRSSCVELIEASMEFGGFIGIDVVVASGSISIMGGAYYRWQVDAVQLHAYLRLCGQVTVLGFISVCIEVHLALCYVRSGSQSALEGEALVKVKVKVWMFSKTVSFTIRKRFAGSSSARSTGDDRGLNGDRPGLPLHDPWECPQISRPTAKDEMSREQWKEYWAAFDVAA